MPRPRVHAHDRRRISRACDTCRRRKEKCDGKLPCEHCASRSRGAGCRYTPSVSRRSGSMTSWTDQSATVPRHPIASSGSFSDVEVILGFPPLSPAQTDAASSDSAPIPKQSWMLRDGRGKSFYIGESASLSYLNIVRRCMADSIGSCVFSVDPLHHQMYEKEVERPLGGHMEPESQPEELGWFLDLAEQYQLAVSGILDLFDRSWLIAKIPPWVADPNRGDRPESPIILLVLAIGALSRASSSHEELVAESHFNYGRQLAITRLMDEPSLATVQAFCLISYYMIASCRRNGAFIHLGIAARAAYALGIHRHETNSAFVREAGIERERAWKSLRVCDLFLSASMGRPPATSETDCNITGELFGPTKDRANSSVSCQVSSAIFRICLVFERILVEVYSKRAVSLSLASSISQQHRRWATELPSILKIDGLSKDEPNVDATTQALGTRVVTIAYYYSIILLSRPFLSIHVGARQNQSQAGRKHGGSSSPAIPDSITTYADACVDSAIKSIDLAADITGDASMPKRQPLTINSVFISALALGHAYLGDYDQRGWPVGRSLDSAISILRHFSPGNPQSARYHEICCHLRDAVGLYAQKRADAFLRSTTQHVKNIFGDIREDDGQEVRARPPHAAPGEIREDQYQRSDNQTTTDGPRQMNFSPESTVMADEQLLHYINGVQDGEKDASLEKTLGSRPCFAGSVPEIRAAFAAIGKNIGHLFPAPPPSLQITDKKINPDVAVRIFSPQTGTGGGQKLPIGVFYHGGGFAVGDVVGESPDPQHFAQHAGCVIVSVGYRLAPEVAYDQILKDAIAGYEWVWENAASLGGDQDNIFAIGESAGACLATQVTRYFVNKGQKSRVRGLAALCPMVFHPASVPEKYRAIYTAWDDNGDGVPMISRKVMETFIESAKMDVNDPTHFITGSDGLGMFPPTFIITTEKDPLRDDGVVLEQILRDNGVTVERKHYDGFGHVFWTFPMLKKREAFLADACEGIKFILSK